VSWQSRYSGLSHHGNPTIRYTDAFADGEKALHGICDLFREFRHVFFFADASLHDGCKPHPSLELDASTACSPIVASHSPPSSAMQCF
jgi:hypothetical protein